LKRVLEVVEDVLTATLFYRTKGAKALTENAGGRGPRLSRRVRVRVSP
jgi:hypothetical protein